MMLIQYIKIILVVCFGLTAGGCVSVKLGENKSVKSKTVQLQEPATSFIEFKTDHLDRAWRHKSNGSTISYLSDCFNETDPTLNNIYKGIVSEIYDAQAIESNEVDYNNRKGLHAIVDGHVDGVATRFELMIFKKNHCTYILTYAATATAFAKNQIDFNKFVKGFKAE